MGNGHDRAIEICKQLGMRADKKVSSGRYLRQNSDKYPGVGIMVSNRYGRDWIGINGSGPGRQWVLDRQENWLAMGYAQHQSHASSHKSEATFIKEQVPASDGRINPKIIEAYAELEVII